MSSVRSAKKENGKFDATVWDFEGNLFATGEFDSVAEADDFISRNERMVTFGAPKQTLEEIFAEMDDMEILLELES